MGRIHLDTISDFSRRGYDLRITCTACGHVVDASAVMMQMGLHRRRAPQRIEDLEPRMKCKACGARAATISPAEAEF
jgi:primosomal protein N'